MQVCVHESLLLWFPILQLSIFGNTSDGMWQVRMESVTDLVIHVHTCARTHTNLHTHAHTHTHTHTSKVKCVAVPLSGHAFWHSQNARALSGPLSKCNATSWSLAKNSQVD